MFFRDANENARLKSELDSAKTKLQVVYGDFCKEKAKNADLASENARLKELLASARAAKECGCLRGEYCGQCKHSVMVRRHPDDDERSKCVCTYGTCPHFEKEAGYEPD